MDILTLIVTSYNIIMMFVGYMADDTNQIIVYGFLSIVTILCAIGAEISK